jgi:hypothetical protein
MNFEYIEFKRIKEEKLLHQISCRSIWTQACRLCETHDDIRAKFEHHWPRLFCNLSRTCSDQVGNSIRNRKWTIYLFEIENKLKYEWFRMWNEPQFTNPDENEIGYSEDTDRPKWCCTCTFYKWARSSSRIRTRAFESNSSTWRPSWVQVCRRTDVERTYCTSPCLHLRAQAPSRPIETSWIVRTFSIF